MRTPARTMPGFGAASGGQKSSAMTAAAREAPQGRDSSQSRHAAGPQPRAAGARSTVCAGARRPQRRLGAGRRAWLGSAGPPCLSTRPTVRTACACCERAGSSPRRRSREGEPSLLDGADLHVLRVAGLDRSDAAKLLAPACRWQHDAGGRRGSLREPEDGRVSPPARLCQARDPFARRACGSSEGRLLKVHQVCSRAPATHLVGS
jgi:hypothetical protein